MKKQFKNPLSKTGGIFMPVVTHRPLLHDKANPDGGDGGSGSGSEGATDEVKAIEQIGAQIDKFNEMLGEKADSAAIEALKAEVTKLSEGLETMKLSQVDQTLGSINKQIDKLFQQVVELQEEKAGQTEGNSKGVSVNDPITQAAVEGFVKSIFPNGKTKDGGVKDRSKHHSIEIKAPEQFGYPQTFATGADITAFTGRRVETELNFRRRKTNIILDYFTIRTIDVPTLIYLRKIEVGPEPDTTDVGGAAWIACGDPKPLRSFRLTTGTVSAKKIAIFNTIDDCLLEDVASFMNWVREDFMDELREGINDGLLNNNPAVDPLAPLGLKTNAIPFSATAAFTNTIESPNYIDAITAVAALFAVNRERLSAVFVSWDVYYMIQILKDSDARYQNNQLVYRSADGRLFVSGVEVVGVDIEDVPDTHILAIGADVGFKIYRYGDMTIETGLNGEDFREDKTSIRGYQRFLSYIAEDRENSVLYDTWANIFTAIEAEAPVEGGGTEG